jgi:uncharacterized coiled-coil DUF342 family protein
MRKMGGCHFIKCVERGQRRGFRGKRSKIFENVRKLYRNVQKLYGNIQKLYRNVRKLYRNIQKYSTISDATKTRRHEEKLAITYLS